MKLFTLPPFHDFGAACAARVGIPSQGVECSRFDNGELHITLPPEELSASFLMGTLSPPDHHLLEFLATAHTLHRIMTMPQQLIAILPYLAYARQDRDTPGESEMIALVDHLLATAGITEVWTFDIHSPHAQALSPIPIHSYSIAPLFAAALTSLDLREPTFVAPDHGAVERCQAVAQCFTGPHHLLTLEKHRSAIGIEHQPLSGQPTSTAIIIDDILDTGHTLVSCCHALRAAGCSRMFIMVTHGLFTGIAWQELWQLGVERIYCTNSVPLEPDLLQDPRIIELSLESLLSTIISTRGA